MELIRTAAWVGDRLSRLRHARVPAAGIEGMQRRSEAVASGFRSSDEDARPGLDRRPEWNRLDDAFMAKAFHELRTPLTPIVAYIELLLDGDAGPLTDEQRRFLGVMEQSAHRLRRLVDDVILLARIDSGRLSLQPSDVELGPLVAEAVEGAREEARRSGVRLDVREAQVEAVRGDRARLSQAVDDLVAHSLEVTPTGGSILVVLSGHGGRAVLEVTASGVAPADARAPSLDGRPRGPSTGSGIGLAVAKEIAEAHGGRVWVGVGEGGAGVLRLELPIALPAESGMRG